MENNESHSTIKLTVQSGGRSEFEKTGVLPEFLLFHSAQLRRTWRLKLKADKQNGVLKVNGQIAFHYFFDGLGCKMYSITNEIVTTEWAIENILMELRD